MPAIGTLLVAVDALVVGATLLVLVLRRRNVHVTLTWILVVVGFPFVGPALYLLLGGVRVRRVGRRRRMTTERVRSHLRSLFVARGEAPPPDATVLALASRLTGFPATAGNRLALLTDNGDAFRRKADAIEGARRSVWAEYYIVEPDETGRGFLRLLARKAREGVDVRLLYDAVGSSRIDGESLEALRRAGGRAEAFLPVNPFRRRWSTHLRNHRKLLVVDEGMAFTGGMNVGNEYSGLLARRHRKRGPWRDTHVCVEGPAARDLARVFAEDWAFQTEEKVPLHGAAREGREAGGSIAVVVPSGPDQAENATALAWFSALGTARERCWITSPYFVPDEPTQRALVAAALRGVDVRLLVPEESDAPLVSLAAQSFLPPLLAAGVRIWRYGAGILHAKTMAVDGTLALVGSANLDVRSFLLNFELGLAVRDEEFARLLEERFTADLAASEEVGLRWWYAHGAAWRLKVSAARLLSPLL